MTQAVLKECVGRGPVGGTPQHAMRQAPGLSCSDLAVWEGRGQWGAKCKRHLRPREGPSGWWR